MKTAIRTTMLSTVLVATAGSTHAQTTVSLNVDGLQR